MDRDDELELISWAFDEIDDISHSGWTLDRNGDFHRAKAQGRREALEEVLEMVGEPYEHREEDCAHCHRERELMEEIDGTSNGAKSEER